MDDVDYEKTVNDLSNQVYQLASFSSDSKRPIFSVDSKKLNFYYIGSAMLVLLTYIFLRPSFVMIENDDNDDTSKRSLSFRKLLVATLITWACCLAIYFLYRYKKV